MGLLVASTASGQVQWHADFESPVWWGTFAQYYSPEPLLSSDVVDLGPPQNHVAWLLANCTNQVQAWSAGVILQLTGLPALPYDPPHGFLKFDVLVSKLRPFHARVDFYASGLDASDMDLNVTPIATNVFQTFLLPISAFSNSVYILTGEGFTGTPSAITLSMNGDPAHPDTTWPSDPDNMFMVDNVSYIVSPPLSISAVGPSVVLSWPTNTTGFVLQQITDLSAGGWTTLTNTPVLTNALNQLILSNTPPQSFYRLVGP